MDSLLTRGARRAHVACSVDACTRAPHSCAARLAIGRVSRHSVGVDPAMQRRRRRTLLAHATGMRSARSKAMVVLRRTPTCAPWHRYTVVKKCAGGATSKQPHRAQSTPAECRCRPLPAARGKEKLGVSRLPRAAQQPKWRRSSRRHPPRQEATAAFNRGWRRPSRHLKLKVKQMEAALVEIAASDAARDRLLRRAAGG